MRDVVDWPPERFGAGKGRKTRKLVMIAIARYADADGTNSFPAMAKIARAACVSVRAAHDAIKWNEAHGNLKVERYGGRHHSNRYAVCLNSEAITAESIAEPLSISEHPTQHFGTPNSEAITADNSEAITADNSEAITADNSEAITADNRPYRPIDRPIPEKMEGDLEQGEGETPVSDSGMDKLTNEELLPHLQQVWNYYLETVGRNPVLYSFSLARKKMGMLRLRECLGKAKDLDKAQEGMKHCIDRMAKSDWHMGRDPKTGGLAYCDWERLFGSYAAMEIWWNR
jgi:hypothetical protein